MTGRLKRLAAVMTVVALALSLSPAFAAESPVHPEQRRGVEQTYLTFPEWFLVYSPAEYAELVENRSAHDFPFLSHLGQLWSSYATVTEKQIAAHYPLNPGYHVMILVIASSTTVEYLLRSAYENSIGRAGYLLSGKTLTAEDHYAAEVARDYVDFIRKEPWYRYSFLSKLNGLWIAVPWEGPGFIRKLERRFALSTEYLIKAVYGWLIEIATRTAYEPALPTTQVVLDRWPTLHADKDIKLIEVLPDGRVLADLPRYDDFRIASTRLARQGVNFTDIAGNTTDILVSVWASDSTPAILANTRTLFRQPLLTHPGKSRYAVIVPVPGLSDFLRTAPSLDIEVEHVYDY